MIPYDLDPSLHSGDPAPAVLDDGFSPPAGRDPAPVAIDDGREGEDAAQSAQSC